MVPVIAPAVEQVGLLSRRQVVATVGAYFDAVNRQSWSEVFNALDPDVTYRYPGLDVAAGRDEAVGLLRRLLAGWSEHVEQPRLLALDGDLTVVEVDFAGSTADGRRVSFTALDVIRLRDTHLVEVTTWLDTRGVRRQLAGRA